MRKQKRKNDTPLRLTDIQKLAIAFTAGVLIILFFIVRGFYSLTFGAPDEVVIVPFDKQIPTFTSGLYSGEIELVISGTGQAGGQDYSDAFYLYAHPDGTPYEPPITEHFDLEIDGQRAIYILGLLDNPPPFSADHVYRVTYDVGAESRQIQFRISDEIVDDNQGAFKVEIYEP